MLARRLVVVASFLVLEAEFCVCWVDKAAVVCLIGEILIAAVLGCEVIGPDELLVSDRENSTRMIALTPTHSIVREASPENRSQRGNR